MGWFKNFIEAVVENQAGAVLYRAVTGSDDIIKKPNGNISYEEQIKGGALILTTATGTGMIDSNPLSKIAGQVSFGKETNKAMLPFWIIIGIVLVLIIRPFGLFSTRRKR